MNNIFRQTTDVLALAMLIFDLIHDGFNQPDSKAALSFFVNQVAQVRLGKLVDVEGASIVNYFENDWITLLHDDVDLKEFPGVALMRMYHQV